VQKAFFTTKHQENPRCFTSIPWCLGDLVMALRLLAKPSSRPRDALVSPWSRCACAADRQHLRLLRRAAARTERGGELAAAARRLGGTTKSLFNEAALTGREHRLVYDLERGSYRATGWRRAAN